MKPSFFNKKNLTGRRGQSLMELLIGMAVGAVLIVGSAAIIASSLQSNGQVTNIQIQAQLGQELLNNTKAWAQGNWNALLALATGTANTYYLNTGSSPFTVLPGASTSSVYSNGYSYSRSISVNSSQVSSTESNFPMLVSGTYSYLAATSSAGLVQNPSGDDIIFTSDSGGNTRLNWQVESYTSSTGNLVAWVKIPTLTSSTQIYMFYGNPSINTFQGNVAGTWNSSYLGVWHLPNGTTLSANDSTGHGNNGTLFNTPGAASGQIYGAASFDGSTQYISLPSAATNGLSTFSIGLWMKSSDISSNGTFWQEPALIGDSTNGINSGDFGITTNGGDLGMWDGLGSESGVVTGDTVADNAWHYVVAVDDGSTLHLYLDGADTGSTLSTGLGMNSQGVNIGAGTNSGSSPGFYHAGLEGEVRISNAALSPSWILTEYNNQNSPFTFYTVGSQNVGSGGGGPTSYSYSRTITVTSTTDVASGTNTNFPMLFSGTYSWLEPVSDGGRIQHLTTAPNGVVEPADLSFSDSSSCSSLLDFETESYNSSTGAISDWVNVPSESAGTSIYVCYGSASVTTDQSHPGLTWNSNYALVNHFPNGTTLNTNDSTANGNNGTNSGSTATAGVIDGASSFSFGNYISYPDSTSLHTTSDLTESIWVDPSNYSQSDGLYSRNGTGGADYFPQPIDSYLKSGSGIVGFLLGDGSQSFGPTNFSELDSDVGIPTGTWTKIDLVRSGGSMYIYLNGALDVSGSTSVVLSDSGTNSFFGTRGDGGTKMVGSADELRLASVGLSSEWIVTEYNNENSPSTFYDVGSEVSIGGGGGGGSSAAEDVTNNGVVFQRSFSVSDVYRDSSGNVTTTTSGNFDDPSTKLITVSVGVASSSISPTTYSMYLTRNSANSFDQATWSGTRSSAAATFVSSTYAEATNTVINAQGGFQLSTSSSAYANGYSYSRSITVNSSEVSSTETNFPMLFSGNYSYLAASSSGGYAQNANGDDIIFTSDPTGSSPLNWEVESYNSSTGNLVAWVNISTLTSSTVIYMFYDNPTITSFQGNVAGTWNSDYAGVWHLPDGSTLSADDSTSNGTNGTIGGATATAGPTSMDGAASFNGSTNYIDMGDPTQTQLTGASTISAWMNMPSSPSAAVIIGKWTDLGYGNTLLTIGSDVYFCVATGGSPDCTNASYGTGTWNYVTGVFIPSSGVYLYINGVLVASNTASPPASQYNNPGIEFNMGRGENGGSGVYPYIGSIDEGRLSDVAMPSSWILTEYNNQSSPSTFYTLSSQTGYGGGGGTPALVQAVQVDESGYSSTVHISLPTSTVAGDTIIMSISGQDDGTHNSEVVSDDANGTYLIAATSSDAEGRSESAIFYMPNAASASTVTVAMPYSYWWGEIYEYSGIKASFPLDQTAIDSGTTYNLVTNWSTSLSTTAAGDVVIGAGDMPDPVAVATGTYNVDWYPNGPAGTGPIFASGIAGAPGSYPFAGTANDYGRTTLSAASFLAGTATPSSASGTLDSEPFDTQSGSGVQLNSFTWQGDQPSGTTINFQFAVSNSPTGPWNYIGPDGTTNTYFSGSPGTPINLVSILNGYTLFNGYRYFAYRTSLFTPNPAISPVVNEVSVNWSP